MDPLFGALDNVPAWSGRITFVKRQEGENQRDRYS